MYAIVESGGKQYKVKAGDSVLVDRLGAKPGDRVEMEKVLLVAGEGRTQVGHPTVPGARVMATSLGEVRGEKVTVFKFKPKVRYRRKKGHRQGYTRLAITEIMLEGEAQTNGS